MTIGRAATIGVVACGIGLAIVVLVVNRARIDPAEAEFAARFADAWHASSLGSHLETIPGGTTVELRFAPSADPLPPIAAGVPVRYSLLDAEGELRARTGSATIVIPIHRGSEFLVRHGFLIIAIYSRISSTCSIESWELATGTMRWSCDLSGLGGVDHSQYANAVAISLTRQGNLLVAAEEAAGRYLEEVDLATGRTLSNQRRANPEWPTPISPR